MVKPKNYSESEEGVDEAGSAVPGGPSPKKAKGAEDYDEDGYAEESKDLEAAFEIFKEAIEEDDEASEEDLKV